MKKENKQSEEESKEETKDEPKIEEVTDKDEEDAKRLEEFFLDEKKVNAAQDKVNKEHIVDSVTKMADALMQPEEDTGFTDFDELD